MALQPRFISEFEDIYSGYLDRARPLVMNGDWHEKKNRLKFKLKSEDFTHGQNATEGVLETLVIFIDAAEGERDRPGVQPKINSIIKNHITNLKSSRKKRIKGAKEIFSS